MSDLNLRSLDPVTKTPPDTRIKDAASLNSVVANIRQADSTSSLKRVEVQKMLDGAPPNDPRWLKETGQDGRCNLNFLDGKARVKAEMSGYYDLTDSVPTLAMVMTDYGSPDDPERTYYNAVLSEEFHRLLKDWKAFDTTFQLLIQNFTSHGLGFLYFQDEVDWRWQCAGLEDFKVPRGTTLNEDECDIAVCFREVTVSKLWSWIKDVPDDDTRWNKTAVQKAIVNAAESGNNQYTPSMWLKWQETAKNNDLYAASKAQDMVKLAHCWVKEFDGTVSQYLTLEMGGNDDFLFKCLKRFDCVTQCFTFFPYEVGTNGTLHSVRGKGHEILASIQVLNDLRNQTVDNAKLSGSLLLQPSTATDAEDMAILFYGGATYIPPGTTVVNGQLNNPSQGILPVIRDITLLLNQNSGETAEESSNNSNEATKFQIQAQLAREAVLPTANMNLFYQPWGRHLNEVWRRVSNKDLTKDDPGGDLVMDMWKRIVDRGVPKQAIFEAMRVMPVRAIGYGSPGNRLLALDEFMQYYGSLDPLGQNNLLRDRFAQKVGYTQVDRYVPRAEQNGRMPPDQEIAELQNVAMSAGVPVSVVPNDHHIIHVQAHMPSTTNDLDQLESGQGTPQLLSSAQLKIQHTADHMKLLKPDKLNKVVVAELTRQFNNAAERVKAATEYAQREAAKQQADLAQQAQQNAGTTPKQAEMQADGDTRRAEMQKDSELKRSLTVAESRQRMALDDEKNARAARSTAARERLKNGIPVVSGPTPPAAAPLPQPAQPL